MKKKTNEIASSDYQKLVVEIQKQIAATQDKIVKSVTRQKVEMAWRIGKLVQKNLSKNSQSGYGDHLIKQLARDTGLSETVLYKMNSFYKTYKKLPKDDDRLNWSHYRVLAGIKKQEERKYLQELTLQNGWDSDQLQLEVSKSKDGAKPAKSKDKPSKSEEIKPKKIIPVRGKLFNYKIAKLPKLSDYFFDCGFGIFQKIEQKIPKNLRVEDAIVTSEKNKNSYEIKKSGISAKQLHCYKARLERVVDGDTIRVILDLGFGIFHTEILRLRAISAAELDTAEGKKSSAVLSKVLKNVEFLVIKTSKTDIYGRYVADVFFAQGKTSEKLDDLQKIADEGIYLNQLLLDLGAVEIF
jgi:hypothetical protein